MGGHLPHSGFGGGQGVVGIMKQGLACDVATHYVSVAQMSSVGTLQGRDMVIR